MHRRDNGSKLFLTELMFSIFFFAAIAAICIQLFANAYAMSKESKRLTQAVNFASNIAEIYTAWDGEKETWDQYFVGGTWETEEYWTYDLSESFAYTTGTPVYRVAVAFTENEDLHKAYICVYDDGDVEEEMVYELSVRRGAY